jgi:hypothetical protein
MFKHTIPPVVFGEKILCLSAEGLRKAGLFFQKGRKCMKKCAICRRFGENILP